MMKDGALSKSTRSDTPVLSEILTFPFENDRIQGKGDDEEEYGGKAGAGSFEARRSLYFRKRAAEDERRCKKRPGKRAGDGASPAPRPARRTLYQPQAEHRAFRRSRGGRRPAK